MTVHTVEFPLDIRGEMVTLFKTKELETIAVSAAGTGKSYGICALLHLVAMKYPGARILILRKTASSLTATTLATWRSVIRSSIDAGIVTYFGGNSQLPPMFRYENGSEVLMSGMDKASKVLSMEVDIIFCDELVEFTEEDWEYLISRLRGSVVPYKRIIGATNPSYPTHWVKNRIDSGRALGLTLYHKDNPRYSDAEGNLTDEGREYIGILERLTGERRARFLEGKWVAAEGLIYTEYQPSVHVIDPFDIPDDWPRYWGIDWGVRAPSVVLMSAKDPEGNLYIYREIYHTSYDGHELGELARSVMDVKPSAIVTDHDLQGISAFEKGSGLRTKPADKKVLEGIEVVQRALADNKLKIFRDSLIALDDSLVESKLPTRLTEELPGYVWKPLPDGRPGKEEPLKINDHACDALRYLAVHVFGRPGKARPLIVPGVR